MPRITKIIYNAEKERYWVYVDGEYCASIRKRTFGAMGLKEGQEITCPEIKEMENFHWKNVYGQTAWDKEKVRLERVKSRIESFDNRIIVNTVGFGADTNEYIASHPDEAGKPDLEIRTRDANILLLLVEVTGTEAMRGSDYWVRPDKLAYAKNHSTEDVWIVLHYAQPERFIYIKPDPSRMYDVKDIEIRESVERYVIFSYNDKDVIPEENFVLHLRNRIDC